jgi:hypothetical protein
MATRPPWRERTTNWRKLSTKFTGAGGDHFDIARMPAHCLPNNSEPVAFTCPSCEAEYKVIAIDAPSDMPRSKIGCLRCDALFPSGEGSVVLKYILAGPPSDKAGRR